MTTTAYQRASHARAGVEAAQSAEAIITCLGQLNYDLALFNHVWNLNLGVGIIRGATLAHLTEQLTPTTYLIPPEGDILP